MTHCIYFLTILDGSPCFSVETNRKHSRFALNPLTCYYGWGNGPETVKYMADRAANRLSDEYIAEAYERPSFVLLDDLHKKDIEYALKKKMNSLCPKLIRTQSLQEKAMRAVLGTGVDAVVLDSDLSAAIGIFKLTVHDTLTFKDVALLFSEFTVPDPSKNKTAYDYDDEDDDLGGKRDSVDYDKGGGDSTDEDDEDDDGYDSGEETGEEDREEDGVGDRERFTKKQHSTETTRKAI
jgi:hypothetical protein